MRVGLFLLPQKANIKEMRSVCKMAISECSMSRIIKKHLKFNYRKEKIFIISSDTMYR